MEIKPVKIRDKAREYVLKIRGEKKIPNEYGLRIGIAGNGCAGVQHILGFDRKKETDLEYKEGDVVVFIEKKHTMYLVGLELDYHIDKEEEGFIFKNPREAGNED